MTVFINHITVGVNHPDNIAVFIARDFTFIADHLAVIIQHPTVGGNFADYVVIIIQDITAIINHP